MEPIFTTRREHCCEISKYAIDSYLIILDVIFFNWTLSVLFLRLLITSGFDDLHRWHTELGDLADVFTKSTGNQS